MSKLSDSDESVVFEPLEFKIEWMSLPTKRNKNFDIQILSTEEDPKKLRVCDLEERANRIVKFLNKILPKKLLHAVYKKLANEMTKREWAEKKRKNEYNEKRKKERYDAMKPDVPGDNVPEEDEQTFAHGWSEDVPDWFQVDEPDDSQSVVQ